MSDARAKEVNMLPPPFSESWRHSYRYTNSDLPRLTTYQAPDEKPLPFICESVKLSGGQAVDTAEFTGFGDWTNTALNNKPQAITVSGFVRGEKYIKNRNELVNALIKNTSDDYPGYLELPTWGRFAVVVLSYEIDESTDEKGQCKISLTLNRAGISDVERYAQGETITKDIKTMSEKLGETAVNKLGEAIEKAKDADTLASGFTALKMNLLRIVGVMQSPAAHLNKLTNEVTQITNLIAQGVRTPRDLLLAVFSAAASIAAGVADIKNAVTEYGTLSNPFTGNNSLKIIQQFLSNAHFTLDNTIEAITEKEQNTKRQIENAFKIVNLYASAMILPELENSTYNKTSDLLSLYTKLESSINQNDTDVYRAVSDLRIAVTETLSGKNFANELQTTLQQPLSILPLAHHLGCDEKKLRELNDIADSFAVTRRVLYV